MPFEKGKSGNPRGRPKQTKEEKAQRERFRALLKESTLTALETILKIANDRYSKDRFSACKYIIDKAYGANAAFLVDDGIDTSPLVVVVRPHSMEEDEEWEVGENE